MADNPEGFSQKDAENLERVKDSMAELAAGKMGPLAIPNEGAGASFARLLMYV